MSHFSHSGGLFSLILWDKGTSQQFRHTYTAPYGQWVHYGITYDTSNTMKLYMNGVLAATPTATVGIATTEANYGIAATNNVNFQVDEWYVFEKLKDVSVIEYLAGV